MSTTAEKLRDRFTAMPRAIQWALGAAAVIGGFLLWDSTIRPISDDWKSQAEQIESDIREVADARSVARRLRGMRPTIASVGPIELPNASTDSHEALTAAVNEILAAHVVQSDRFASRPDRKFSKKFLAGVTTGRVESIRGELSFEATPEVAADIVAALESHPAIECIRSLQMVNAGSGRVEARLTLEAWGIVEEL